MFWGKNKRAAKLERDRKLEQMMVESQLTLVEAASSTADAARDLTTKLKSRLEDSIRQFESTARILNDALFVTDLDGTIQSFNPAAGRLFGRTELVGTSICELFVLGDEPLTDANFLWGLAEHSSAWLPNSSRPLRGVRPGGFKVWIEPSITRLDWSNQTASMLIIVRNQEPLVGLSESARLARHQYKTVFEASYDGIIIEQRGIVVAANPTMKRMFGYAKGEILGLDVKTLFAERDHEVLECCENEPRCVVGTSSDGATHPVMISAAEFVWQGAPARFITVKETRLG